MNQLILFLNIVATGMSLYLIATIVACSRTRTANVYLPSAGWRPKKWVWTLLLICLAWLSTNFLV